MFAMYRRTGPAASLTVFPSHMKPAAKGLMGNVELIPSSISTDDTKAVILRHPIFSVGVSFVYNNYSEISKLI